MDLFVVASHLPYSHSLPSHLNMHAQVTSVEAHCGEESWQVLPLKPVVTSIFSTLLQAKLCVVAQSSTAQRFMCHPSLPSRGLPPLKKKTLKQVLRGDFLPSQ